MYYINTMTQPFENGFGELQPFNAADPASVLQNFNALEGLLLVGLVGVRQMRDSYLGSLGTAASEVQVQDLNPAEAAEKKVLTNDEARDRLRDTLRPCTSRIIPLALEKLEKDDPRLAQAIPSPVDTSPQKLAEYINDYGIQTSWKEAADSGIHEYNAVHLSTGNKDAPRLHSFTVTTNQKFETKLGYNEEEDVAVFTFNDNGEVTAAFFQTTDKHPRQGFLGIKRLDSRTKKRQLLIAPPIKEDAPILQVLDDNDIFSLAFKPQVQLFESDNIFESRAFSLDYLEQYLQPSLDRLPRSIRP